MPRLQQCINSTPHGPGLVSDRVEIGSDLREEAPESKSIIDQQLLLRKRLADISNRMDRYSETFAIHEGRLEALSSSFLSELLTVQDRLRETSFDNEKRTGGLNKTIVCTMLMHFHAIGSAEAEEPSHRGSGRVPRRAQESFTDSCGGYKG